MPLQRSLFENEEDREGDPLPPGPPSITLSPPRRPLPPALRAPQVIHVLHSARGESEPVPKMVGKVIPHGAFGLVFYHAQSGSQRHRNTDCPAPTDVCLIRYLRAAGIEYVYAFDREEGVLFRAKRLQIEGGRIELHGNRKRHYLPEIYWQKVSGLAEVQAGRSKHLLQDQETVFVVPYLPRPIVVLAEEMF